MLLYFIIFLATLFLLALRYRFITLYIYSFIFFGSLSNVTNFWLTIYIQTCLQRTCYITIPGKGGHFFKEPAESWSNSHRKTSLQRTLFEDLVKILGKIYLLIADTLWLVGKKKKIHACFYSAHSLIHYEAHYLIFLSYFSFML